MPGNVDYGELLAGFHSDTYRELRPAQAAVLEAYAADHRDHADVGLEVPTGAGKSLIALLIAEAWRQEGRSAVVLSANRALARQMQQQADAVGIQVCRLEGAREDIPSRDLRMIQRRRALGVMNYWVYFNQKPALDPASLVVMDDAHMAEGPLQSLYSLILTRFDHQALFQRVADDLAARLPHYGSLVAAAGGGRGHGITEVISFVDQHVVAEVLDAVLSNASLPGQLGFVWPRLRERLDRCVLLVSRDALWLRPWVYPLQTNEHYSAAEQRLYLSATIGDPADLARRLGTEPITMIRVDPSLTERTLGRRLVVLDPSEDRNCSRAALAAALSVTPKSVWLCSSRSELRGVSELVAEIDRASGVPAGPHWTVNGTGETVERFRVAERGHLFAAGRFDGMDFADDECRVIVVPHLPNATNPQEEFIAQHLGGGGVLVGRQNARIVQALGRANRSEADHAVYLLSDPRFAAHLSRESFRHTLPTDLNVEVDIAQDAAEEAPATLARHVTDFMSGRFDDYDRRRAEAYGAAPSPEPVPDWSEDVARPEIDGWHALWLGDYARAERCLVRWSAACEQHGLAEMGAFARWSAAKAAYLSGEQGDAAAGNRARALLEEAIADGGRFATWFNGLRPSLHAMRREEAPAAETVDGAREQILQAFDAHLLANGASAARLQRLRARVEADLASRSHSRCQLAIEQLGTLLGYQALRPKFGHAVTDVRWTGTFAGFREMLCLELKIEHLAHKRLSARDVDQALGQVASAETEWGPRAFSPRGAVVTSLEAIEPEALQRLGSVAVIRLDAIQALWERVSTLVGLFRDAWSPDDARARSDARARVAPRLPDTGWLPRALSAGRPWVTAQLLLAEWPGNGRAGPGAGA